MNAHLILLPKVWDDTLRTEEWHELSCENVVVFLRNASGSDLGILLERQGIQPRDLTLTGPTFRRMRQDIGVRIETDNVEELTALMNLDRNEPRVQSY